jgi:hypothetical protein
VVVEISTAQPERIFLSVFSIQSQESRSGGVKQSGGVVSIWSRVVYQKNIVLPKFNET